MKYGKKTLTKKISVTVKKADTTTNKSTPTPTPPTNNNKATPTPPTATETPAGPTEEPTDPPKPGYKKLKVDLSTAVDAAGEPIPYDKETNTLSVKDISIFRVDIPEALAPGSVMDVTIKGVLNEDPDKGKGFRAYFINNNEDVNIATEIANSDEDNIAKGEPFEWNFTLEVSEDLEQEATQLQFKGITYADNIEDLTVSEIVMEYKNAAGGEQQQ